MTYIGNIGSLLKSVYVRNKLPKNKFVKKTVVKTTKNTSKFTYINPTIHNKPELTINDKLLEIRSKYREEIRIHGEQTSIKEGFVYLISNDAFPGWVKAGMTIDFENRSMQYNIYDPLSGFKMHSIKWVDDRRHTENLLLSAIGEEATTCKGEWFLIEKEQAINIFTYL